MWWEHGGSSAGDACARDVQEFLRGGGISLTVWNWHVWLEDAEGRVYSQTPSARKRDRDGRESLPAKVLFIIVSPLPRTLAWHT